MTPVEPKYVLGIDQGKHGGWAFAKVGGSVFMSGVAKTPEARVAVVGHALNLITEELVDEGLGIVPDRLLLVYEDHSDITLSNRAKWSRKHGAPERNAGSLIGMGRSLGRWDGMLDWNAHPERLRLGVTSEDWRMRVLGCSNRLGTEELKERAKRWASAHTGRDVCDDNEAEAICIAAWGALDGLGVLLAQRVQRRTKDRIKRELAKQKPLAFE